MPDHILYSHILLLPSGHLRSQKWLSQDHTLLFRMVPVLVPYHLYFWHQDLRGRPVLSAFHSRQSYLNYRQNLCGKCFLPFPSEMYPVCLPWHASLPNISYSAPQRSSVKFRCLRQDAVPYRLYLHYSRMPSPHFRLSSTRTHLLQTPSWKVYFHLQNP